MTRVSFLGKAKNTIDVLDKKKSQNDKTKVRIERTKSKRNQAVSLNQKNPHVQHRTTSTNIYRDTNRICQCGCIIMSFSLRPSMSQRMFLVRRFFEKGKTSGLSMIG